MLPFKNGGVPESGQTGSITNRAAVVPSWVQIPPSGFKKLSHILFFIIFLKSIELLKKRLRDSLNRTFCLYLSKRI